MGTDWQYKPTNDPHKSGTQIINMLIETRAKGGNLLLNIGPKPNGEIQIEQEALLREVALWNLVNTESIHSIRPWEIIKEGDIWFTKAKDSNTVYAFVQGGAKWAYGTRKELILTTLEGTEQTKISILGYAGELIEYRKDADAGTYFQSTPLGLIISAVNGHRLYTNNQWPNPVVLKIENVKYKPVTTVKEQRSNMDGAK
jgi:alpha-L-fucosidase